jgi:hypothetical protein
MPAVRKVHAEGQLDAKVRLWKWLVGLQVITRLERDWQTDLRLDWSRVGWHVAPAVVGGVYSGRPYRAVRTALPI